MCRISSLWRWGAVLSVLFLFAPQPRFVVADDFKPNLSAELLGFESNQPLNQLFYARARITNHEDRPVKITATIILPPGVQLQRGNVPPYRQEVVVRARGSWDFLWPCLRVSPAAGRIDVTLKPRFYDSPEAGDWGEPLPLYRDGDGVIWRSFRNYHPTRSVRFKILVNGGMISADKPTGPGEVGRVRGVKDPREDYRYGWFADWADNNP